MNKSNPTIYCFAEGLFSFIGFVASLFSAVFMAGYIGGFLFSLVASIVIIAVTMTRFTTCLAFNICFWVSGLIFMVMF